MPHHYHYPGPPDNCGNYNSHLPFTVGFWSTNVDQNNYQSGG